MTKERFDMIDMKAFVLEALALALLRIIIGTACIAIFCKYTSIPVGLKIIASIGIGYVSDYVVGKAETWYIGILARYSPRWKEYVENRKNAVKLCK